MTTPNNMTKPTTDVSGAFYNAGATADLVTVVWVIVFVAWVIATGHNFFIEHRYELAELPAGVVSVLVAIPLLKTTIELVRTLKA